MDFFRDCARSWGMRHWFARACGSAVMFGSACTGQPSSLSLPPAPEQSVQVFAKVPAPRADPEPEKPLRVVGPNPGCPSSRVFQDEGDLCRRGILPWHPYGECERLPLTGDDDAEPEVRAATNQIAALDGSAELFVKHYIGGSMSSSETVFLALRGSNGYVLLTIVADYDSQGNDVPELESFVGTATSVALQVQQDWFDQGDDWIQTRVTNVGCTLTDDGGIRCNEACPDLALDKPMPALDCAALSSFDWDTLSPGEDTLDDWGLPLDDSQLGIATSWLGIDRIEVGKPPHRVREIYSPHLTILEPVPGRWISMHGEVPLVASEGEIRVGRAPGGLFVSSRVKGERRIQRLNIDTHELEPVFPGACD